MKNYVLKGLLIFMIIVVLAFVLELTGLQWTKFFAPKKANIQREVFEQNKSYVHGKIQDLSKYYGEYIKAETESDKEAISSLIKMQFAEFDEEKIANKKLKRFLINIRGF